MLHENFSSILNKLNCWCSLFQRREEHQITALFPLSHRHCWGRGEGVVGNSRIAKSVMSPKLLG